MPQLNEVLKDMHLKVLTTVQDGGERLLLIARQKVKGTFPPPQEQCYTLAVDSDNPWISDREAAAIKRHFAPPDNGGLTLLNLDK